MSAKKNLSQNKKEKATQLKSESFIKAHFWTILSFVIALVSIFCYRKVFHESEVNSSYSSTNTVLLYFSIFSIGCMMISLLKGLWRKIVFINWIVVFIIIGAFESYVRAVNYDNILNYSEVNGYDFTTDYLQYAKTLEERKKGRFLYQHGLPNSLYNDNKPEFNFSYQLDNFGNNNSRSCGSPDAKVKIITLGDSYTFGLGARAGRSWPDQLDSILKFNHFPSSVCNIAASGADPVYMLNIYRDMYVRTYPGDIILVSINASDAKDLVIRGGAERYYTAYEKGKEEWLPYYASSLIYRMYMQKVKNIEPYLLVDKKEVDRLYFGAFDHIFHTMIQFDQFAKQNNKQVVFVFNPGYHEVLDRRLLFEPLLHEARNFNFHVIDLLPVFLHEYQKSNNIFNLFWEKDFHNNEAGYKVWAEEVYRYLYANNLLKSNNE